MLGFVNVGPDGEDVFHRTTPKALMPNSRGRAVQVDPIKFTVDPGCIRMWGLLCTDVGSDSYRYRVKCVRI
jgi:hypothetical protein